MKNPKQTTHSVVLALPCQSRMPRTLFLFIDRFVSGNGFLNKMFKPLQLLYESLEGTFKFSAKKQNKIVMIDCATRSLGLIILSLDLHKSFPWISNSLPRFTQLVTSDYNSFL